MKVTSIEVFYARKMQPQAYESADCSVKLSLSFEEEAADVDAAISDALDTVQSHVLTRLGLADAISNTPAAAPAKEPAKRGTKKAPEEAVVVAVEKAPEPPPVPAVVPKISDADLIKAISGKVNEFVSKARSDGGPLVMAKIKEFLPDDKPPHTPNRIAQERRMEFITALNGMQV